MPKQSNPYPKPTTKMVIDQTLRGYYAMNAPDVPDWFEIQGQYIPSMPPDYGDVDVTIKYTNDILIWSRINKEEIYFQWRWYYADRMIEQEFKK